MLSIFGGIPFYTSQKNNYHIESVAPPKFVYIKIKDDCEISVSKGDTVLKGCPLAFLDGFPIAFASVSGVIENITPKEIIIENDFNNTIHPILTIEKPITDLTVQEIEALVNKLNIYDRETPLAEKISKHIGKVENVIVSCIDTELTDSTSSALISNFSESIIYGLKIIIHAVKARNGIIAIGSNSTHLLNTINDNIDDKNLITTRIVESIYPADNEKCLLYALKRKEISGSDIIDKGKSLIIKAETVKNLYESMISGLPALETIITVSGKIKNKKNLAVPIGCKISHILDFCKFVPDTDFSIITGGLMKGIKATEESIIDFSTKSITVIKNREYIEKECIRCGKCIDVCPMLLKPLYLYSNALKSDFEKNKYLGINQCIGCGCCTYICPSKIPLSDTIYNSLNI